MIACLALLHSHLGTMPVAAPTSGLDWLRWPVTLLYLAALGVAALYGLHRYWLVICYYRTRYRGLRPARKFENLPHVTVQLPLYNESAVAERIIASACAMDYPRDRLQIQVLDDSTDECAELARRCAARFAAKGHMIEYLHRDDRRGFKAGALEAGMASATGEFIAVFDADFVPPQDFLHRTVHYFTDDSVGMVQAAWDHLNGDDSRLTRAQAIFLDSHFHIEHPARNRSRRWMHFNGTAGIWRRNAITSAGGWQHDTLTEDVDLSYRAQLAGWQFVFVQDLPCPAELPPEIRAFKSQQHRWTKGSMQVARKLLPQILRSSAPWRNKLEAAIHLTSPVVYPCVVLIALLMAPAIWLNIALIGHGTWAGALIGLVVLLLSTGSGTAYFLAGQRESGNSMLRAALQMPMLMALGVGMSLSNSRAVLEALAGHQSAFVRTPKYNGTRARSARRLDLCTVAELMAALYLTLVSTWTLHAGITLWSLPFIVIFLCGFLWVGAASCGLGALLPLPRMAASTHGHATKTQQPVLVNSHE